MPKSHNKKRNVGLVYELLLRRVSECLVNEDNAEAQKALDIISKRFKKGTELYREFRLFRALAKSHVSETRTAQAILSEAKSAARKTDLKKLEKEKSDLIREMNYRLNDKDLYRRYVPDYKELATIQVLINDWRDGDNADIQRMAQYETKVCDYLLREEKDTSSDSQVDPDVNSLVVKIMSEKINKKYEEKFNSQQKNLLRLYAFSDNDKGSDSSLKIENYITTITEDTLSMIKNLESTTENQILKEKIDVIRHRVIYESSQDLSDQKIVRFLTLIDLCNEIRESAK